MNVWNSKHLFPTKEKLLCMFHLCILHSIPQIKQWKWFSPVWEKTAANHRAKKTAQNSRPPNVNRSDFEMGSFIIFHPNKTFNGNYRHFNCVLCRIAIVIILLLIVFIYYYLNLFLVTSANTPRIEPSNTWLVYSEQTYPCSTQSVYLVYNLIVNIWS